MGHPPHVHQPLARFIYAAGLGPALAAGAGATREGALELDASEPDIHLVVEIGPTVLVHDRAAPSGAVRLIGDALTLIEALSFRAPLDHPPHGRPGRRSPTPLTKRPNGSTLGAVHVTTKGVRAMFIQTIEGKTNDPDALHRQLELWQEELQPGAIGYLGSTGGVTAGGDCILIARFQSADAARQNSERPEQSAWWAQTRTCFDGPVRFHDTTDVQVMRHGDPNTATFVQVMEGHVTDRHRAHELAEESDETLTKARPDLIEAITAYFDNDEFTEIAYFTNQQDARANEGRDIPSDMAPMFAEWESVMKVERYLDVNDPWLVST